MNPDLFYSNSFSALCLEDIKNNSIAFFNGKGIMQQCSLKDININKYPVYVCNVIPSFIEYPIDIIKTGDFARCVPVNFNF